MKLLIIKEIDGYNIITKIEPAGGLIDPEASRKIGLKKMAGSQVGKQIDTLKSQMTTYARQATQAKQNAKDAKKRGDKEGHRKFSDEFKLRLGQMKELEKDLLPLAKEYKSQLRDMIMEYAIYFNPRAGEELIENADADTIGDKLTAAYSKGYLLTRDLKEVPDYRGDVYWKKSGGKWVKTEISKIDVNPPSGGILEKNLTEENWAEITAQFEADRIVALNSADKAAEKSAVLDGLADQANAMRGRLEIQGDNQALKKSQDWYNAEAAKVEAKYK